MLCVSGNGGCLWGCWRLLGLLHVAVATHLSVGVNMYIRTHTGSHICIYIYIYIYVCMYMRLLQPIY